MVSVGFNPRIARPKSIPRRVWGSLPGVVAAPGPRLFRPVRLRAFASLRSFRFAWKIVEPRPGLR